MTPEERLDRIERLMEKNEKQSEKRFARQDARLDKQNQGIQGLVVAARTVLTSLKEFRIDMDKLREAQVATDEKLNILIDTVDRIIRRRNGKE